VTKRVAEKGCVSEDRYDELLKCRERFKRNACIGSPSNSIPPSYTGYRQSFSNRSTMATTLPLMLGLLGLALTVLGSFVSSTDAISGVLALIGTGIFSTSIIGALDAIETSKESFRIVWYGWVEELTSFLKCGLVLIIVAFGIVIQAIPQIFDFPYFYMALLGQVAYLLLNICIGTCPAVTLF
jgi:hypothetical protein